MEVEMPKNYEGGGGGRVTEQDKGAGSCSGGQFSVQSKAGDGM